MAPSGTRSTAEEREQRRAAERELAERAVEEVRTSAGWQRWLRVRRHFHRYSLHNQILISMQNPGATHVAGSGRGSTSATPYARERRRSRSGCRSRRPAGQNNRQHSPRVAATPPANKRRTSPKTPSAPGNTAQLPTPNRGKWG